MKNHEAWIVGGVAAVILLGIHFKLYKNGIPGQPQNNPDGSLRPVTNQPDKAVPHPKTYDGWFPEAIGQHFVHPNELTTPVVLPVQYPARSGHELTTIIEYGMAPLFHPRKNLFGWVDCPPSEGD